MTAVQAGVVELSATERDHLAAAESVIERGLKTFVEVGQALIEIRDRRLYRTGHATFEEYCEQRWQISARRAYQLLDAAQVHELISRTTVQEINNVAPVLPANEAQVRPLAKLLPQPEATQQERDIAEREVLAAWNETVRTAPLDPAGQPKVTAKHVEATVERHTEAPPANEQVADRKPARRPITDAFLDASLDAVKAVERLERLVRDDRYPRNAEQVARMCRGDLLRAADLLAAVLDRVPNNSKE